VTLQLLKCLEVHILFKKANRKSHSRFELHEKCNYIALHTSLCTCKYEEVL